MTTDHVLADLLDETIAALATIDAERLENLGARVELLSQIHVVDSEGGGMKVLVRKRVLEILLQSSESNLRLLKRLYERGRKVQWQH
jgi:hypothetical protein